MKTVLQGVFSVAFLVAACAGLYHLMSERSTDSVLLGILCAIMLLSAVFAIKPLGCFF